jgi:hypothetical protein
MIEIDWFTDRNSEFWPDSDGHRINVADSHSRHPFHA